MTLCTPPCLHQDYCAYYSYPFEREPSQKFVGTPLAARADDAPGVMGSPSVPDPRTKPTPLGLIAKQDGTMARVSISEFGRVETGRNPPSMEALNGISSARPSSHFWIAGTGVTGPINSQVRA